MLTSRELAVQERERKRKEILQRKVLQAAGKFLQYLDTLTGAPANFSYFSGVLERVYIHNQLAAESEQRPKVGTFCVMVPQELVYAAGGFPIKLCSGNYVGYSVGDDSTARDACPLVKAVAGCQEIGNLNIMEQCSMYAVPLTCDCKKKMADILGGYRETMVLHVPMDKKNDRNMEFFVQELAMLKAKLEKDRKSVV